MEQFIVSALKYRPETFDTVVGQTSITTTLKNAIQNNHLAHAYLFCGPRGVGKTTCARIFAKTINCANITPETEPCNECDSCKMFNESSSFNIHELDAASNNSVDSIRSLIEQVRIPPQTGKYSTYIIDEVHMLSSAAFNAFLKTLEEPPHYAIFILATTEKHKIIPTILSRCQIFDFNRIKIKDITGYLEKISEKESISYETEAFIEIAQKADGAMRDALSIYDQVVSFSGNNITYKNVIENLNVLDYDYYFQMTDAFLEGDRNRTLLLYNTILEKGFDGHNFINRLSSHFRDLLVCKDKETLKLFESSEKVLEKYVNQTIKCSEEFLFDALKICNQCDIYYKTSKNQRLHVELTLLSLCSITGEKKKSDNTAELNPDSASYKISSPSTAAPAAPAAPKPPTEEKAPADKKDNTTIVTDSKEVYSSTPSLKNVFNKLNEKKENEAGKQQEKQRTEPFTIEQVNAVLNEYLSSIQSEKPFIYSILKRIVLNLKNEHILEITLNDNIQSNEFKSETKPVLLPLLRETLKNNLIDFEIKISEKNDTQSSSPYTLEDKYEYLKNKNPHLDTLKKSFNLDF